MAINILFIISVGNLSTVGYVNVMLMSEKLYIYYVD